MTGYQCPNGHQSSAADYCEECGLLMLPAEPEPAEPEPEPAAPNEPAAREVCAKCGAAREGRFCEACGHDSALPVEPVVAAGEQSPPSGWLVVARADREWFEEVRRTQLADGVAVEFPPFCPRRRFDLDGARLTIGRRSRARGVEPDIDLSGPPLDPGVSAQHAMLLWERDGWRIVDLGSTNGTTVDGTALTPNVPVPVGAGGEVKLGAWTVLTLVARAAPDPLSRGSGPAGATGPG